MSKQTYSLFDVTPGAARTRMGARGMDFNTLPVTLHPFTMTAVNCTPACNHTGGRPCLSLAGAGAATDGENLCIGQAGHRFVAGKQTRLSFSVRNADATNHAWVAGFNIVSTGICALYETGGTPSTDFLLIHKTSGSAVPRLRARKASGTAASVATSLTMADATWYDFDVVILPDSAVAGVARVQVYVSTALATEVLVLDTTLGAECPDTVSTALCFGFLEGDTGTDSTCVGHLWMEQEY
jgi:hypothetical protein